MSDEAFESRHPPSTGAGGDAPRLLERQGRLWATARWVRDHWQDPLYRNSYYLMLNTLIITGSGFLFWLIAARLAPPEEVGVATATVSAILLLSLFAKLGFDVSLLRYLPQAEPREAHQLVNTAFTLSGIGALVAAIVFIVGVPWWAPTLVGLRTDLLTAAVFVALTLVWTHGTLIETLFTARRRSEYIAYKNVVQSVLKVVLVFVLAERMGATGIVLAAVGSMLAALLLAMALWLPRTESEFSPRLGVRGPALRDLMASSAANYATSLLMAVPLAVGSLIILERSGPADAASFYVFWMIGSIGLLAPSAFARTALVEMAHGRGLGILLHWRPLLITVLGGAGVFVAGAILLPLYGPHYSRLGVKVLLPYVLAAVAGFFFNARTTQMRATGQHGALVLSTVATVAAFLVGIALLPEPLLGAGVVWLGALTMGTVIAFAAPAPRPAPGVV